jgi:hypothetical protein
MLSAVDIYGLAMSMGLTMTCLGLGGCWSLICTYSIDEEEIRDHTSQPPH